MHALKDNTDELSTADKDPWKVIIVDDDQTILQASVRLLRKFIFEGRKLEIIIGSSGAQAKQLIAEHADTAVIILDVIMETKDAGLQVVTYIRNELGNNNVRILLRTGQAGQFDEEEVFEKYNINDFLEKADLSSRRLKTAIKGGLRAFRMLEEIDATVQREMILREAADAANQAKSEFLANMSHELRSPMSSIKSGLTIIKEVINDPEADAEDWEDAQKAVKYAESSADRLMGLVNGILDLSKLEAGKMVFNIQSGDIKDLIDMASHEISPQLQAKSLTLKIELNGIKTELAFDFSKMMQVFINLLNNAIKFTAEGKQITVSLSEGSIARGRRQSDSGTVATLDLCVSDQGIGIPEDELFHVFDKFVQSSKTKDGSGGTGLGLPIAQEIMLNHGGHIWAENNQHGGANFIISLRRN